MKSCADNLTEHLIRRGEHKVQYLTLGLIMILNSTQVARQAGHGREKLLLFPMPMIMALMLWGITSALRSTPLNIIRVMLRRQTRTTCEGIPDKAGAFRLCRMARACLTMIDYTLLLVILFVLLVLHGECSIGSHSEPTRMLLRIR